MSAFRGKLKNKNLEKKVIVATKRLARLIKDQEAREIKVKETLDMYKQELEKLHNGTETSKRD